MGVGIPGQDVIVAFIHASAKFHPMIFFHGIVPLEIIVFFEDGRRIFFRIPDDVIHG
jgi:hypothetical protein